MRQLALVTYLCVGCGSRPGCVSSAGKVCAPPLDDSGLGCAGAAGWPMGPPGCDGFGAAEADAGTGVAEADCWPRVLVVTAVRKRRAASSFVVTAPVAISVAVM